MDMKRVPGKSGGGVQPPPPALMPGVCPRGGKLECMRPQRPWIRLASLPSSFQGQELGGGSGQGGFFVEGGMAFACLIVSEVVKFRRRAELELSGKTRITNPGHPSGREGRLTRRVTHQHVIGLVHCILFLTLPAVSKLYFAPNLVAIAQRIVDALEWEHTTFNAVHLPIEEDYTRHLALRRSGQPPT